jgi:hypothetical protein
MSFFTFLRSTDDLFQPLSNATNWGVNYSAAPGSSQLNLQTTDISQRYTTTNVTGGYNNLITVDLGAPTPWNQIMLVNHDFDPSVVITIKSGTTSGVIDHTDTMTYREIDAYFRTASTRTDRYLTIGIVDAITASHAYSIGRLMIGLAVTLDNNFSYDWRRRHVQENNSKRSELGARSVNKIRKYFEFVFTFEEMTDAQAQTLTDFTDSLNGDAIYLFLIPDPAVYKGYVVTLSSSTVEEVVNRRITVADLVLTEESRGVRMAA